MKSDLRLEAVYPYPPERVWRALTDPRELAQWLMNNNFEAKVGHKFELRGQPRPGFDGTVHCEIVEIDPYRELTYKWVTGNLHTTVRFSLQSAEHGGTRLRLEHSGFESAGSKMISASIAWKRMLRETLPTVLSGGATPMSTTVESNVDTVAGLVDRYEHGTAAFLDSVASVPEKLLDVAAEGDWSVRQTAMHIVDAELVGATRLRMIAAQPGSKLPGYAGDVWGRELGYAKQPLEPALELFQALRRSTAAMLRQLPGAAWSRRAEHEEAGEVTLESYLDSHCEHAESHLQEIKALLERIKADKLQVASSR